MPASSHFWLRLISIVALLLFGGSRCINAQNVVLEWNQSVLTALKGDTSAPLIVTRNLAILHLAIRDAVDQEGVENIEAAAIGAASLSAGSLFPSHQAQFERLRAQQIARLDNPSATKLAIAAGETVARRLLNARANDGSARHVSYLSRNEPGQWRRTPPVFRQPELPQWATSMKPFSMRKPDQFLPPGPPSLRSEHWKNAFNEIKVLGAKDSIVRTQQQTAIARFWADFSSTETPAGHWNSIASTLAREGNLSLVRSAHLFATLNVALADTGIACWNAKYHYNFWRPVTAIARAAEDGNPGTQARGDWQALLNTPPHPEYPSGHSAFSGAAATVLSAFFGTDHISFRVRSDTVPGVERKFTSLRACAEECGESRVYGGIHYRFSCDDGLRLGMRVAEWTLQQMNAPDTTVSSLTGRR
jgi:membrane-associated phospholipid phosphatase